MSYEVTFQHRHEIILLYRRKAGISQEQLATACGISVSYLSQIERGHREPSAGLFKELTEAIGVKVSIRYVITEEPKLP